MAYLRVIMLWIRWLHFSKNGAFSLFSFSSPHFSLVTFGAATEFDGNFVHAARG